MKTLKLIFFFGLVLLSEFSFSQNATQLRFIADGSKRPSVVEMLQHPESLEDYYLYSSSTFAQTNQISYFAGDEVATLIVGLEKAYPNGIYAFLGRDMDMIADAIEAYYTSKGQGHRITRIPFSTGSLDGITSEMAAEYLSDRGLSFSSSTPENSPFVIIDYTSFSSTSQSRFLIHSAVSALRSRGFTSSEIPNRIGVFTLKLATDPLALSYEQILRLKQDQQIIFSTRKDYFSVAYSSEWHGSYGPLRREHSGRLVADPSSTADDLSRKAVYHDMIDVIKIATSEEFDQKVQDLARIFKVEMNALSGQRVELQVRTPMEIREAYQGAFEQLFQKLSPLDRTVGDEIYQKFNVGGQRLRLSENAYAVARLIDNVDYAGSPSFFIDTLRALIDLYNDGLIGARDMRRLFILSLGVKPIGDGNNFFAMINANYEGVLPLRIALSREREREKYSSLDGMAGANYRRILEVTGIEQSDDCNLALGQ